MKAFAVDFRSAGVKFGIAIDREVAAIVVMARA